MLTRMNAVCAMFLSIATVLMAGAGGTGTIGSGGGNGAATGYEGGTTTDGKTTSQQQPRDCHAPKAGDNSSRSHDAQNGKSDNRDRNKNCPH